MFPCIEKTTEATLSEISSVTSANLKSTPLYNTSSKQKHLSKIIWLTVTVVYTVIRCYKFFSLKRCLFNWNENDTDLEIWRLDYKGMLEYLFLATVIRAYIWPFKWKLCCNRYKDKINCLQIGYSDKLQFLLKLNNNFGSLLCLSFYLLFFLQTYTFISKPSLKLPGC